MVKVLKLTSLIGWWVLVSQNIYGVDARCHYCRYKSKNCTDYMNDSIMEEEVCDENGKVRVDDLFCGGFTDCKCSPGFDCIDLEIGCGHLNLHKPEHRCISIKSLSSRFKKCRSILSGVPDNANVEVDWIHYKDFDLCKSQDCIVTRQFEECDVVECGHLVTLWKIDNDYNFVIEGSRKLDLEGGSIQFTAPFENGRIQCSKITSRIVEDCHNLQTRNDPKGVCEGTYIRFDNTTYAQEVNFSKLSWPIYLLVIGSILITLIIIITTLVICIRNHKKYQDDKDESEIQKLTTPSTDMDITENKDGEIVRHRSPKHREKLDSA